MTQKPPLLHKLRYLRQKTWPVFHQIPTYKYPRAPIKLKTLILKKKMKTPKTQSNHRIRFHFMFPRLNTILEEVQDQLEIVAVGLQQR